MTDNELKKLGRRELLEILLEQSREIDRLKGQLAEANQQLAQRQIMVDNAGSIAEASLQINGVFESAQKAAEQYLENIRLLSGRQEEICEKLEAESREEAAELLLKAQTKCELMETETRERCARMTQDAEEKSRKVWEEAQEKIQQLIDQQAGLRELLGGIAGEIK